MSGRISNVFAGVEAYKVIGVVRIMSDRKNIIRPDLTAVSVGRASIENYTAVIHAVLIKQQTRLRSVIGARLTDRLNLSRDNERICVSVFEEYALIITVGRTNRTFFLSADIPSGRLGIAVYRIAYLSPIPVLGGIAIGTEKGIVV